MLLIALKTKQFITTINENYDHQYLLPCSLTEGLHMVEMKMALNLVRGSLLWDSSLSRTTEVLPSADDCKQ